MYHCLRSWAIYMKKTTGKATNKPANVAARLRFLPTVTRKINVKSNKRREREETKGKAVIVNRRRSGQSVTVSDFGSNGPRFESGRGRCVESLDKALYSHCHVVPRRSLHMSLASISYLAILVKYILAKKKKVPYATDSMDRWKQKERHHVCLCVYHALFAITQKGTHNFPATISPCPPRSAPSLDPTHPPL